MPTVFETHTTRIEPCFYSSKSTLTPRRSGKSACSYEVFGSAMPGRNSNSGFYKFGFNGQEMDNEITGQTGTLTTAMFWEYDTRLGRRWNLDPKPTASVSRYACFNGNPIWFSDPLGDTVRYEKFRDRIATGISRLFNRDFNERVKGWKSKIPIEQP
jgi:RHS repeat-associated protein